MEAQSLGSHQHSWWFSCFSLREKLARSHNKTKRLEYSSRFCLSIQFSYQIARELDPLSLVYVIC